MDLAQFSKRKAKGIKLLLERPEHEKTKESRKIRKFEKSNRKKEVRCKKWDDLDEDNEELEIFQKSRKVDERYKSEKNSRENSLTERKTFSREDPLLGGRKEKGIIANLDQLVIVVSVKNPPLKAGLIDRFLLIAEKKGFDVLICLNKIDLAGFDSDYRSVSDIYSSLGYKIIFTSTLSGAGIDELRENLKGKCSLFMGHSGVGKSSLLNAVEPGLGVKVGRISDSTNKGRHTTTSKKLLTLSFGGEVLDAPGIKQLGLLDINKRELPELFPEFRDKLHLCRFSDCTHTFEENCGIKEAVDSGNISLQRYESFLRIRKSLP